MAALDLIRPVSEAVGFIGIVTAGIVAVLANLRLRKVEAAQEAVRVVSDTAKVWEDAAVAHRERAEQMEARLNDERQKHEQTLKEQATMRERIGRLEALPDLTVLLNAIKDATHREDERWIKALGNIEQGFKSMHERIAAMEARAATIHEQNIAYMRELTTVLKTKETP